MAELSNDASQEVKDKIKTLIESGNTFWANPGSEGIFPLNLNARKPGDPYEFTHISLGGCWGERKYPNHPEQDNWGGFVIYWGCKNVGFGELTFCLKGGKKNEETGIIDEAICECDSETMSRRFVKAALAAFAETIVMKD